MADVLEYSEISTEIKGAMTPGRLKLTEEQIIFKNNKTGKVEQISGKDIDIVNWQKLIGSWGLRIFLKNGHLHRFGGFKEGEQEKVAKFFTRNYSKDMLEKEMCYKGWNWGTAKFQGSLLSFDIGNLTAFEVPLNNVSQCKTGKNEVTVEFHQNDDASVSLMEMRFHIPPSELAAEDPVDNFHQNVMSKANVINVSGDAVAIFRQIQCLTPRGHYDITVFSTFFQLHGKTFDYKIPTSTVLRLFLLPHHDKRRIFFVVSLDPPIKQGQTRYHFFVCLFSLEEDEISIELPYTEEELKDKFDGKLEKEMKGQTYEVLAKLTKTIVGRKLTQSSFKGKSDTPAIGCSYKAAAGYLYPLERGFIYIPKPPFHIRFEEIACVNFARSSGTGRSFDFEIELKTGTVHTFSSIEKDEYKNLFDFISDKKLKIKNIGKGEKPSYNDDLVDSDKEEPDAYLNRIKREAEERDEDDGGSNDDESTDEDFNPNQAESDVAEEYDSNPASTDTDDEGGSGGSGKEKKEKKKKSAKTISEKPRKKREKREKKMKDINAPKRPQAAFMLWMNETREKIKQKYPKYSITEIAKKGGEMWRELKDKSEWEEKYQKAKEEYDKAMEEYKKSGAKAEYDQQVKEVKTKARREKQAANKKSTPVKVMSGAGFKSKEYVSDTDSSSDDQDAKKPKKSKKKSESEESEKVTPKKKTPDKKAKKGSESDDSEKEKKKVSAKKTKTKGSDDEKSGKGAKKKEKSKGNSSDEDDNLPSEPEESTPPTSQDSGASDSD